jgi:hypothetical protein
MTPLFRVSLFAVAVLGVSSAVLAQGRAGQIRGRMPNPVARVLDQDGDGEISAEELAAAPQMLKKLDENGDGSITRDELGAAFREAMRQGSLPGAAPNRLGQAPNAGARGSRPGTDGAATLERAGLEVGQTLPELTILDADGQSFPLARLRGRYSVLVFGCLT